MQKIMTPRDRQYLDFIATLPCILCGKPGPSDPHHTASGGMGITGSDYSAIPVCREHHTEIHNTGGKASFCEAEVLEQAIERLQHIYFTQIKGDD